MLKINWKKWTITCVTLFTIGTGAKLFADVIDTPKNHYLQAELTTFNETKRQLNERFGNFIALNEALATKASTTDTSFTSKLTMNERSPLATTMQNFVNTFQLSSREYRHPEKKLVQGNVQVGFKGSEPLTVDYFLQNNTVGMKSTQLHSKALYLNGNDYGKWMRLSDQTYKGDETIDFNSYFYSEQSSLSTFDLAALIDTYRDVLAPYTTDQHFVETTDSFSFEKKRFNARKITWSVNGKETQQLLLALISKAKTDGRLALGLSELQPLTNTTSLAELEKAVKKSSPLTAIRSTIYVNDDNIILKRDIALSQTAKTAIILTTHNVVLNGKPVDQFTLFTTGASKVESRLTVTNVRDGKVDHIQLAAKTDGDAIATNFDFTEMAKDHYQLTLVNATGKGIANIVNDADFILDMKGAIDLASNQAAITTKLSMSADKINSSFSLLTTSKTSFNEERSALQLLPTTSVDLAKTNTKEMEKISTTMVQNFEKTAFGKSLNSYLQKLFQ